MEPADELIGTWEVNTTKYIWTLEKISPTELICKAQKHLEECKLLIRDATVTVRNVKSSKSIIGTINGFVIDFGSYKWISQNQGSFLK